MKCKLPPEKEVMAICSKACEILKNEGNVQRIDSPVVVGGGGGL